MSKPNMNLKEMMEKIESILNEKNEPIQDISATYQFNITDVADGIYQLILADGSAAVNNIQNEGKADCTLRMSFKSFEKFLAGKLNGTMAFMTGKLKVDGDMTKALKLESLLKTYRPN